MRHYEILIPGNYSCNFIMTGLPGEPQRGQEIYAENLAMVPGGVMNTVIALKRLGVDVGWLGAVGNDFFSRAMVERAEDDHVDTSLLLRQKNPLRVVTVALSYPEDRALVSYADPAPAELDLLAQLQADVKFERLHFGMLIVDERLPELLRQYKANGIFISSDCQYQEKTLDDPLVREIIALLDVFIPNASEVTQLTGEKDLEAGAQKLAEIVPCLVVKDGSNGSHAWQAGQHYFERPIDLKVKDTTGAGDVFNAGFLAALINDLPIQTCLRWGNIAGGLATQGYGGTTAAPVRAEVEHYLKETFHEKS